MSHNTSETTSPSCTCAPSLSILGLGRMGTALARAWLAAGCSVTVWNRTASRADALVAEGAALAPSPAAAVAANTLVVTCLLDDASVGRTLEDTALAGKDLIDITTGTPGEARARDAWARVRGARFLSGGVMAVPPMVGVPEAGGHVLYSGSREVFDTHRDTLAIPLGTEFTGPDAGHAALQDVALLSGMYGVLAGITHAFALVHREEGIALKDFAPRLADWLTSMSPAVHEFSGRLESGEHGEDVVASLSMQVAGIKTFTGTAREQGVSPELLTPYFDLMKRRADAGRGDEGVTGLTELLRTDPAA